MLQTAPVHAAPDHGDRPARVAWLAGGIAVSLGLLLRIAHRGPYIPGWDVVGAAEGLLRVSTQSAQAILREYWEQGYVWSWTVWNLYAAPYTLLPGWLASLRPWEYWAHVVTLATTAAALLAVRAALAAPARDFGVLLLAWGSSATLLSWAVAGLSVVSAFLVHALAIAVVLRLGRRWMATALAAAGVHLLSWHAQDLAQTVFVVFLAAAATLPGATRGTRAVWVAAGALQLLTVLTHPTQARFREASAERLLGLVRDAGYAAHHVVWNPGIDLPLFLGIAAACVVTLRTRRGFWWLVVGTQLGLVVALASRSVDAVWPRRCVLLLGYLLVAVAARHREMDAPGRRVLVGCLVIACGWQVSSSARWAARPLAATVVPEVVVPLPYAETTLDYRVVVPMVEWYDELLRQVASGRRLLLLYNHASFMENTADPSGVLERLYLVLGDARYRDCVFAVGDSTRWVRSSFPLRPLADLPGIVERVAARPDDWVVWTVRHDADAPELARESLQVREALERRFAVRTETWRAVPDFGHLTIARLVLSARQPRIGDEPPAHERS